MNYTDFFDIYLERKTWGADVLKSEKIIKLVIDSIKKGDLSLYSHNNTLIIKLPVKNLKIRLKAFNNYSDPDQQGAAAVFKFDKAKNPLIELFVFETFRDLKTKFRGRPLELLNRILFRIVNSNLSQRLYINLQHELEHAFESDKGIDMFDLKDDNDTKNSKKKSEKEYFNEPAEINARIVQFIYPVNTKWSTDFENGEWLAKHSDPEEIKYQLKIIMDNAQGKIHLTEKNLKKTMKGVYTTLQYLWDHYTKKANTQTNQKTN